MEIKISDNSKFKNNFNEITLNLEEAIKACEKSLKLLSELDDDEGENDESEGQKAFLELSPEELKNENKENEEMVNFMELKFNDKVDQIQKNLLSLININ